MRRYMRSLLKTAWEFWDVEFWLVWSLWRFGVWWVGLETLHQISPRIQNGSDVQLSSLAIMGMCSFSFNWQRRPLKNFFMGVISDGVFLQPNSLNNLFFRAREAIFVNFDKLLYCQLSSKLNSQGAKMFSLFGKLF